MSDPYAGLSATDRDRLDRFAAEFEDVDPVDYGLFAGSSAPESEIEAAREVVSRSLGSGPRRRAVQAAIAAFMAASDTAMARRWFNPALLFAGSGLPTRPDDRARFAGSLERAAVAVIVWDDLTEDEREVLAGPWARVVERALAAT